MAIKIYEKFAPRANPADGDYPYGSIKNESVPGAKDGTPLDAVWANDYAGFDAALLADSETTPSGDPDTVGSSQRLEAIKAIAGARVFISLQKMVDYTGHKIGNIISTGGSRWRINATKGLPVTGGLFAQPIKIVASDFVDATGATGTVDNMNALIILLQSIGGCQIDVTAGEYVIDAKPSLDEYNTGWLVPPAPGYVFGESKDPITFKIYAGARLRCFTPNSIMIRASTDHVKFLGSGRLEAYGIANVAGIAFVPVNMNENAVLTSNSYGYVAPTLSLVALTYGVITSGGPTIGGQDSGSFYHNIGFSFLHVDYPYWAKDFPNSNQNLTTRTTLNSIRGGNCISSMIIDAGEIATQDCKFENMSGEVIKFKTKGKPANVLDNSLSLNDTTFEVYGAANELNQYGVLLGDNVNFLGAPVALVSGINSPRVFASRVTFGSGNGVTVTNHSFDTRVSSPTAVITYTANLNGATGVLTYQGTNLSYIQHFNKTLYGGLELNDGTFNGYKLIHSGANGRGIYVSINNDGFSDYTQLEGAVGANYRAKVITSAVSGVVYYETGNGSVYNLTGTYGMISDSRTKESFTECRDYTDDIMKLVVGTYTSKLDGCKYIGLIADAVKDVFPSLVETTQDKVIVDGKEVTDLLTIKSSPMLFMLLDIIKRQEIRLRALESK